MFFVLQIKMHKQQNPLSLLNSFLDCLNLKHVHKYSN